VGVRRRVESPGDGTEFCLGICDCFAVDSEDSHNYFVLVAAYTTELSGRYKNFIDRHNLMAQFLAEDAAGKR
jgi:hypothetical protein